MQSLFNTPIRDQSTTRSIQFIQNITTYIGGTANALDAQLSGVHPLLENLSFAIDINGLQFWETKSSTAETDVDNGIVRSANWATTGLIFERKVFAADTLIIELRNGSTAEWEAAGWLDNNEIGLDTTTGNILVGMGLGNNPRIYPQDGGIIPSFDTSVSEIAKEYFTPEMRKVRAKTYNLQGSLTFDGLSSMIELPFVVGSGPFYWSGVASMGWRVNQTDDGGDPYDLGWFEAGADNGRSIRLRPDRYSDGPVFSLPSQSSTSVPQSQYFQTLQLASRAELLPKVTEVTNTSGNYTIGFMHSVLASSEKQVFYHSSISTIATLTYTLHTTAVSEVGSEIELLFRSAITSMGWIYTSTLIGESLPSSITAGQVIRLRVVAPGVAFRLQ
jgi:hypothetical protein